MATVTIYSTRKGYSERRSPAAERESIDGILMPLFGVPVYIPQEMFPGAEHAVFTDNYSQFCPRSRVQLSPLVSRFKRVNTLHSFYIAPAAHVNIKSHKYEN